MRTLHISLCIIFCVSLQVGFGQRNNALLKDETLLKSAYELYEKEKYGAAQNYFRQITENEEFTSSQVISDAHFYMAMCARYLENDDVEYLFNTFIENYPESPKLNLARLELMRFYYDNKKYRKAISYKEQLVPDDFEEEEQAEIYFVSGYCNFMLDDIENARIDFFEAKTYNSKYKSPSIYYYSHINYQQKNYQTALDGFLQLQDDKYFALLVPYYISQIYFLQENYDKVVDYAPALIDSVTEKRKAEVARIIAESYFKLKKYDEAIPFYDVYLENSTNITEEDFYQLGYAYYSTGETKKAAETFEKISANESLLGQNASYHLADCYIKLGDKNKAMIAFSNASKYDFDPQIKEDAMFNYAVASYELNYSPFNESVRNFEEYLKLYPSSRRADEAYQFLVEAYLNTNNYKVALASIERIKDKNVEMQKAYQKIAYYRGAELFNNAQYREAIIAFDKSLNYKQYDQKIKARAMYWKAESYFDLGDYTKAAETYTLFVNTPGAFQLEKFAIANYNLGYAYFKDMKYQQGLTWFRKFVSFDNIDSEFKSDAYNRIGDIYYLLKDFKVAARNYHQAGKIKTDDSDYSFFQKGICHGVLGEHQQKVESLYRIVEVYPASKYADDALFGMGDSYMLLNDLDNAQLQFESIDEHFPSSVLHKKALLQLGLIHYNQNKLDEALRYYKRVIAEYPGTQEARSSLTGIKNIYLAKEDIDNFFAYVDSKKGTISISVSEQDSLSYFSAENLYMAGKYEQAVDKFNTYLDKFENGSFKNNAHFYMADGNNQLKNFDEALKSYQYIISLPKSEFMEEALLASTRIYYSQEKYKEAMGLYEKLAKVASSDNTLLEARLGIMRTSYLLEDYKKAIDVSEKILNVSRLSQEFTRETKFKTGKAYYNLKKYNEAYSVFEEVAENLKTQEGAEARYLQCEILFNQKKYKEAEDLIFDFVEKNSPHQYWLARSFILLSDIYMIKSDNFQAMHTLQSILDYYETKDDGIITMAKEKKSRILELEVNQYSQEEEDIEIPIDNEN